MPSPNILLILNDSTRPDCLAVNGGPAQTPAYDSLVQRGVHARRAWCTSPICHPSRASIITGLNPYAHGFLTNTPDGGGWPFRWLDGVRTLPELLSEQGYNTGYAGQEHIAMAGWTHDRHEKYTDYKVWAEGKRLGKKLAATNDSWFCGARPLKLEQTREGRYAAAAEQLLDEFAADGKPWFVQVDFDGPHPPCYIPEAYAALYDPDSLCFPEPLHDDLAGKAAWVRKARWFQGAAGHTEQEWRRLQAHYLGNITMIDDLAAKLLRRLERHGQAENTIVLYSTDHSSPVGARGFAMHGGPTLYEEVLRVPLAMAWPAGLPAGRVHDGCVRHVDLVPTLLDLAELPAPPRSHGISRAAELRGNAEPTDDESYAVYSGTGKFLMSIRAYRHGRWKLVYTPYAECELYDLKADPYERDNLAGRVEYSDAEGEVRRALAAYMERVEDPLLGYVRRDLTG